MVKLLLRDDVLSPLKEAQDAKLFIHHLLLGLSDNSTLSDLTLILPPHSWDWPQGELIILHCFKKAVA